MMLSCSYQITYRKYVPYSGMKLTEVAQLICDRDKESMFMFSASGFEGDWRFEPTQRIGAREV